jgi:hypothetical protein
MEENLAYLPSPQGALKEVDRNEQKSSNQSDGNSHATALKLTVSDAISKSTVAKDPSMDPRRAYSWFFLCELKSIPHFRNLAFKKPSSASWNGREWVGSFAIVR